MEWLGACWHLLAGEGGGGCMGTTVYFTFKANFIVLNVRNDFMTHPCLNAYV